MEQPAETASKRKGILRETGTIGLLAARKQLHRRIKARGEPPARAHGYWTDRNITTGWGYGGWDDGKGSIIVDLCEPVNVSAVKLIWPHVQELRRRNERSVPLRPDEISVRIAVGNDGSDRAAKELGLREGAPGIHYMENQPYMYTRRFQCLTIPVGVAARSLRLEISPRAGARQAKFFIDEILVVTDERSDRAHLRMAAVPNSGPESANLAAWSKDELLLANIDGGIRRKITLDGPIVDLEAADVDSDGQCEIVMFPLSETFTILNADGSDRSEVDLYAWGNGPQKGASSLRPACIVAWRPGRSGRLEYAFFPHCRVGRISPEPKLRPSVVKDFAWGGKAAFPIPDITGDGRDDLAVVGTYGANFVVMDARSDIPAGKLRAAVRHPLTGYSSGNMQFPLYFDGAVVRATDTAKRWLGVVALNPGGINFYAAPDCRPKWSHFNYPPNRCFVLWDAEGTGVPDILVGREDGYVTRYRVEDGRARQSAFVGPDVRGLATVGRHLAAASSRGLTLLDAQLRTVDLVPRPVDAVTAVGEQLAVGFSDGAIVRYEGGGGKLGRLGLTDGA